MRAVESQLTADLGGDPSTGERLLIQAVAVKATRAALLADKLLEGEDLGGDGHHVLAWLNSMRLDLAQLGLQRRAREIVPGRAHSLAGTFDQPYRHAAE